MRFLLLAMLLAAQGASPIFRFETDGFWLNLHHFLYVLGRAELEMPDSRREAVAGAVADQERGLQGLNDAEQKLWRDAVTYYARNWSRKELVFEPGIIEVSNQLKRAPSEQPASTRAIDRTLAATLDRAAPLYRKAWWERHRAANREWLARLQPLLKQYGPQLLAYITRAYQLPWTSDGYPVQVAAWSNWAGAYSTSFSLLVVSSLNPGNAGSQGLESVFHEAMHQWDDAVAAKLQSLAAANNLKPPHEDLSHAILFFTAGEAARAVVPNHTPMADAVGIWNRGLGPFKPALDRYWKPYLDGTGTLDDALLGLLKS